MYSERVKSLIIVIIACTISACMSPGVKETQAPGVKETQAPAEKEPQADQDVSTSETDQATDRSSKSPGHAGGDTIKQTWVNPDISADGIGKVLVIAINDDELRGAQYEIELTAALRGQGVDAVPRANILRLQGTPGKERIEWFVNNDQFDHVLVTRLCPLEDNELRQAGSTEFEKAGALGQFGQFWERGAQQPINPRESGKYAWLFVETSLFESGQGMVVWRTRNQTSDPIFTESPAEFIGDLTSRLRTDGLIL